MASLKIFEKVQGSVSTTDQATWTTVASYTLLTNAVVSIKNISVVGKDGSGNIASAQGMHRVRRVSGTLTAVGSLVDLITMIVGSDAALATSEYRINISGDIIQLQVKGVAATTIEWMGEMGLIIN